LLEINNAIVSNLELRGLINSLSDCLNRYFQFDQAVLYLYEPESGGLREQILDPKPADNVFAKGLLLPVEGSASGKAFKSKKVVVSNSDDLAKLPPEIRALVENAGIRSACSLPLLSGENALGVLSFLSFSDKSFSKEIVELLERANTQITIAVVNAISYQRIERENARFGMLLDVSNALSAVLELNDVLKITSSILRGHIRHDFAAVGLHDDATHQFRILSLDNPPDSFQDEGTFFPAAGTPDELAIKTRQYVLRGVIDVNEFKSPFMKIAYDAGFRALCCAPLISRNRVIGVLAVATNTENSLTTADAETIQLIANQIAGAIENAVQFNEIERLKNRLVSEKLYLEEEIQNEYNFAEIVGTSATLRKVLKQIETVAPTDSCVLLYGETGTGKELISRAIHNLSGRRERTLVKLNCAAIPTGLLESELFGHEKGAFTGAVAPRVGRFELAHKGTLLLDEIGDIPFELQPKLLRVLQESEFERLGSSRTIKTDVRLIAATNANLPQLVEDKKFRSDLFYRLNVFPITIPPLRERREDIPLLAGYFAQKHARRMSKRIESIPRDSLDALCSYEFPGNVRELENFIERAVILTRGDELQMPLSELQHFKRPITDDGVPMSSSLRDIEREHIADVLKRTGGRVAGSGGAAEILNLPVSTLRNRMKKLGLI
jgi:formate hydrogenlyase transcriptional activator